MGLIGVSARVPGAPALAESVWYDTARWPSFIDGLAHVVDVGEQWPEVGAAVHWQSHPAGRGEVVETVVGYEAGARQTVAVVDIQLTGRQSVSFEPTGEGETLVTLALDYRLSGGGPLRGVTDVLFVRRALTDSLRRTLAAFQREVGR